MLMLPNIQVLLNKITDCLDEKPYTLAMTKYTAINLMKNVCYNNVRNKRKKIHNSYFLCRHQRNEKANIPFYCNKLQPVYRYKKVYACNELLHIKRLRWLMKYV